MSFNLVISDHLSEVTELEIKRRERGETSHMSERALVVSTAYIAEYKAQIYNKPDSEIKEEQPFNLNTNPYPLDESKYFWNLNYTKTDSFCPICNEPVPYGSVAWLTSGASPRHNTEKCSPPVAQRRARGIPHRPPQNGQR